MAWVKENHSTAGALVNRGPAKIKRPRFKLLEYIGGAALLRHGGRGNGWNRHQDRDFARAPTDTISVWIAAVLIPLFLIAPALWNGYPLLQWDTGGYLARWYEGYLVPSRSTVFGLYLHFGEGSDFWINLGVQALATLWILQLRLRVLDLDQPFRCSRSACS